MKWVLADEWKSTKNFSGWGESGRLSIDKFHGIIRYMVICGEDESCELNEKLEKFQIIPDKYDPLNFEG